MNLVVKKFGGTSVGSLERIRIVAQQLLEAKKSGETCVVVVSAMQGETDRLIDLAYQLSTSPNSRELASLVTTGEQVSTSLLAMALYEKGIPAVSYQANQLPIETDGAHHKAQIKKIHIEKIACSLKENKIPIIAGFQGISEEGDMTTLGRGGSDTSAVALAAALNAKECQIFTDVDGVYTADPRIVPKAYRLETIPFKAMLELASLGSKVLQWRSVALAGKYQIPLRVLSSFKAGNGTLMNYDEDVLESPRFSGISHQLQLTRWTLNFSKEDKKNFLALATYLSQHNIRLEHLNQCHLSGSAKITLVVSKEDQAKSESFIQSFCEDHQANLTKETGLARIALVGLGLQSYAWVLEKFLSCLQKVGASCEELSLSELSLCAIISEEKLADAAKSLHQVFFE